MHRTIHYRAGGNPPTRPNLRYDHPRTGELIAWMPGCRRPPTELEISLIEAAYEQAGRPLHRQEVLRVLQ